MSEINKNSNELDDFSAAFRSKLENHQMPVDVDLWDSIHASILPSKPTSVRLWWWISTGSAAAIAFLLVFIHPALFTKSDYVAQSGKMQIYSSKNFKDSSFAPQEKVVSSDKFEYNKHSSNTQIELKLLSDNNNLSSESKSVNEIDSAKNERIKLFLTIDARNAKDKATNRQQKKSRNEQNSKWLLSFSYGAQNNSQSEQIEVPTSYSTYTTIQTVRKQGVVQIDWTKLPTVGATANGYTSTSVEPTSPKVGNISIYDTIRSTTVLVTPGQLTDIHYWQPFSFGLKIRNEFSKRLSVESGFIYTYLQTDYSYSGAETYNASLCLHYLGLPLNLNLKLWQNPRWEVYISGGGAVEKALNAVYEKTQQGSSEITTEKMAVEGLQLSANTAAGVSYKFHPQLGLYCEPQAAYYFDNNQPLSIRTKQALVVNVQVGLRYQLNKKK